MKNYNILLKTLLLSITISMVNNVKAQSFVETFNAQASNKSRGAKLGIKVSISGNVALVGSEINRAYIYEKNSAGYWEEKQVLQATGTTAQFGVSVSIDGNTAVIGATHDRFDENGNNTMNLAGAAYIFEKNSSGIWVQVQKIVASDRAIGDVFGKCVSISGNYLVVGADYNDYDENGNNMLNSSGAAYVFEKNSSGVWVQVKKLTASDRAAGTYYGNRISISGNTVVVGAFAESRNATGGSPMNVAGAAYVYERNGSGIWQQKHKLVASDRSPGIRFGESVSVSGNYMVVGAWGSPTDEFDANSMSYAGAAYIFEKNGAGNWIQKAKIVASDRHVQAGFGVSVCVSGNYIVSGSWKQDYDANGSNMSDDAGAAYVFKRSASGTWSEIQKITASDRATGENFGYDVAINGNLVVVGAYNQGNTGAGQYDGYGKVYLFPYCAPTSSIQYITACNNYVWSANGKSYQVSGIYKDTIVNATGCDSIINLNLTINYTNTDTQKVVSCESYTWAATGVKYSTSGLYNTNLTNYKGCDSLAVLSLTINQSSASFQSETVCDSVVWNGITYKESGSYSIKLTGYKGCDSFANLNLYVIEDSISVVNIIKTNVLTAEPFGPSITYQWFDCSLGGPYRITGADSRSYTPTSDGVYSVVVYVGSCSDTSDCIAVTLNELGIAKVVDNDFITVYPNPSSGKISIQLNNAKELNGVSIFDFTGKQILKLGNINQTLELNLIPGIYTIKASDGKGVIHFQKIIIQ